MFFGGLFAYDLVAGFENLPPLEADTACPDYCFYLAKPCWLSIIGPKIPAFSRACSPRWKMKTASHTADCPASPAA